MQDNIEVYQMDELSKAYGEVEYFRFDFSTLQEGEKIRCTRRNKGAATVNQKKKKVILIYWLIRKSKTRNPTNGFFSKKQSSCWEAKPLVNRKKIKEEFI